MELFRFVIELGFPIASAIIAGYFVFLTLKFILAGVTSSVQNLNNIIVALDNRVKTMAADIIRIDTLISSAFGIRPDIERIGRADGKTDARKD